MDRVIMVVGQGAAVPHRGLSNIQDLITHSLLVVVHGHKPGTPRVPEEAQVKWRKGRGG